MTYAGQRSSKTATYAGLGLAFFGITAINLLAASVFSPAARVLSEVIKQFGDFALLGVLLWIVVARERLPLRSIGWHTDALVKSLLWGLLGFLLCNFGIGVSLLLCSLLQLRFPAADSGQQLWLAAIICLRAGIVEEVFFRGYAIERIKQLSGSTALAFLVPLGTFSVLHYGIGWVLVLNAFIVGSVLSLFYWWRRDLLANMIAHFLVDCVPLVVFPWLAR